MPHKGHYYLPQGAQEFYEWTQNFTSVAGSNAGVWGFAQADIDVLKAKSDDLGKKILKSHSDDANKADIRAKNAAHHDTQTLFRDFVNEKVRYNKNIDNDGRAALRVTVPDTTKTPIPAPTTRVAFAVKPVNEREHRIDFWDEATDKKAIPYGYSGVLLFKKILEPNEPVPTDPSALPESKLLTATPHVEEFLPSAQGRRAAYAACWQSERGDRGPVSDVQTHIVP